MCYKPRNLYKIGQKACLQSTTAAYKWSWPRLSEPKSCISSVFKPRGIAFISPPLWVRSLTVSLLLTLVLTHYCLLNIFTYFSLFSLSYTPSLPPRPLWPPVQPHITQLKNVTAVEGSAAMISCVADGEPLPDISWRRASDGQTFVDGDKVESARKCIWPCVCALSYSTGYRAVSSATEDITYKAYTEGRKSYLGFTQRNNIVWKSSN